MPLSDEILRRRTFAIISHPDAGKTTLTEKLLLYGGAIDRAGSVKAREGGAAAHSDWMSIEQERGISFTSAAMQFEYLGKAINLLDTPGHQDFMERVMVELHNLVATEKKRKRVGRGGSRGGTSGKGHKGQKARTSLQNGLRQRATPPMPT